MLIGLLGDGHEMKILLFLCLAFVMVYGQRAWEQPGCHLVGNVRKVRIPGCTSFPIQTNACRGYCTSFTVPAPPHTLYHEPSKLFLSNSQCCVIQETHDVTVKVRCQGGDRLITFKSARSCDCAHCSG